MRLVELRDAAEAARAQDERAAQLLNLAQERLKITGRGMDQAGGSFAEALLRLGGRAVDLSVSPPMLYTATENGGYYRVDPVALFGIAEAEAETETASVGPVS